MSYRDRVSSSRLLTFFAGVLLAVAASTFTMSAQGPGDGPTVWDNPVYTDAQADRGAGTYAANCSRCHADDLGGGGRFAQLVGDPWMGNFQTQSVADLFRFIQTNMPNGNGGSLSTTEYLDLAAFILRSNGMPAGEVELSATSGEGVVILPEDGEFLPLQDNTLVRVVGCLAEGDNGWVVNSATTPSRISSAGMGPDDATVALGDRSIDLLFVLLPLDEYIGHRVSVSGITSGVDAVEGINVSIVESVSDTCQ